MNKIRLTALILSAVMSMTALASCKGNSPVVTTGSAETTADASGEFMPKNVKYNDEFVLLVSGKDSTSNVDFKDFSSEDAISTSLDEAVYKKNAKVEELYGIDLVIIEDLGSKNQGMNKINTSIMSGTAEYDAAIIAAYDAVPLATSKCLYELSSLPGVNLKNSWWDQKANEDLSINDCVFFTTGDISFWDDMQQHVIGFNKQLKNDLNIEDDFYELVEEGKWTHEALATYAKLATQDLNSDSVMDMNDKFGIITWDDSVYAIFGGSGEKVVTIDETGSMKLTLTGSERIVDVLTSYTDICFGGDAINYQRYTSTEAINMFSTNRSLFFLARLQSLAHYRDMETDYGILPYPKYDEAQKEYHTAASPFHMNFVCVPANVDNPEMSGNVLEALSYYGKEYTTPAYYDKTLTGQYFRDEDSMKTLELMAATRTYDVGLYIQPANINKELIFLFREGKTNFASTFDSLKNAAEAALAEVSAAYAEAAQKW